jgi:hypothetical protein
MTTKPNVTIYSLSSSEDGVIRYIGQTTGRLDQRLIHHHYDAKKLFAIHKSNWIRSVINKGFEVVIAVIELDAPWAEAEIKWIKHYRDIGHDLVNTTDGGEGVIGYVRDAEWRARCSARAKGRPSPGKGKKRSAETRAKISAVQIGKVISVEHRAKLSAATKGKPKSEETRQRMILAQRARAALTAKPPPTEAELREKAARKFANLSARSKGKILDAERKQKISAGLSASYQRGRRPARSKLTDDQVREIRKLLTLITTTGAGLARDYGVAQSVISEIRSGKSYQHVK